MPSAENALPWWRRLFRRTSPLVVGDCVYGEHECQGSFIGERFCLAHGGHSTNGERGLPCPRVIPPAEGSAQ